MPKAPRIRWPPQVTYIVGNEACERFSFYGMRGILTAFLVDYLLVTHPIAERAPRAKEIFHLFVMGVYFFPLLGGYLADRYFTGAGSFLFYAALVSLAAAELALVARKHVSVEYFRED